MREPESNKVQSHRAEWSPSVRKCVCRHYGERLYSDLVAEADAAFAEMRCSVGGVDEVSTAAGTLDEASLLSFDRALRQVRKEHILQWALA